MGPWDYKEGLDRWRSDRWSADREAGEKVHLAEDERGLREHNERAAARGEPAISLEEYRTKWYIRGATNDLWLWPGEPPRTCSFCGGIHPDDAIKLLTEGWEVEGTGKRYLHPPGFRARHAPLIDSIDRGTIGGGTSQHSWEPVPPVKLYDQHFNDEQIVRFNNAALGRSEPRA
jgi:hypothetical protein